ncbi:MAG: hypothetical protein ACMVY4_06810 [Minwuia sp.]|uniref:hypothetical protein n=1 Tax=Minwuia sp. TaxID=2493630 RepID=UPI003A8ACBBF
MAENTAPWGKGEKPTPEAIEAAIRVRYPTLINDERPVIKEQIAYDDGSGFAKDEEQRGPDRADWSRDFVVDVLRYAEANKCSRNAAIEAMHEEYCKRGNHKDLPSRKRIFNRYHGQMRIHNFCLAVMNNDIKRAVREAMQSQTVRNLFLLEVRRKL